MLVQTNQKTLYVDIDNTLIMSNLSDYADYELRPLVFLTYPNRPESRYIVNVKNLNYAHLLYKQGFDITFWSKNGGDWAKIAYDGLKANEFIDFEVVAFLTKPVVYLDDKICCEFMGDRRWRDCK